MYLSIFHFHCKIGSKGTLVYNTLINFQNFRTVTYAELKPMSPKQ